MSARSPTDQPRLPNLIVIGAAKAGTTSLHRYLDEHPEVAMSGQKELQFFLREDWREAVPWYRSQFDPLAPVRGESTPGYSMYPYLPSTAERIAELIPGCRLIYMVRDPVDRAIANYVELVALRLENRPIEEAFADPHEPANPHICPSRYASQLERFLACFDSNQILVVDQADLRSQRRATLARVFGFVGVDVPEMGAFEELHNVAETKVRYNRLGHWMVRKGIFTEAAPGFRRGPLRPPLRALLSKPIPRALSQEARLRLVDALSPEVERLRTLTGASFAHWHGF